MVSSMNSVVASYSVVAISLHSDDYRNDTDGFYRDYCNDYTVYNT